ncbi:hypothetical protein PG991_014965 [Apiospora marii]|uniref:Uncharacterized protein n=1 Tax=Apiospora marii TaxID=335849 RepID=A0ABR1R2Q4_9PEZI
MPPPEKRADSNNGIAASLNRVAPIERLYKLSCAFTGISAVHAVTSTMDEAGGGSHSKDCNWTVGGITTAAVEIFSPPMSLIPSVAPLFGIPISTARYHMVTISGTSVRRAVSKIDDKLVEKVLNGITTLRNAKVANLQHAFGAYQVASIVHHRIPPEAAPRRSQGPSSRHLTDPSIFGDS